MWAGQTILPIADPPPPLAALRPSFSEYGLGWRLRDYRGRKLVSHTGGLAGMTSQITLVPAERLGGDRSEEHTSELQSPDQPVCRLLLEKKKTITPPPCIAMMHKRNS